MMLMAWLDRAEAVVNADADSSKGMVNVASGHSVPDSINRLESIATSKGLRVFARIDFSGDASSVGLQMPPTQMLIFGSPKAGTPLMLASPSIAIDLPLKVLAWQDADGRVWMSYNASTYLKWRHGVAESLISNISGIKTFVEEAAL